MLEKPIWRSFAQSISVVTIAPDWERRARSPLIGPLWAKLAFMPIFGTATPRQLGPTMRRPCGRAASSMACFGEPGPEPSPAVMTTAAFTPLAARPSMMPGTVPAGVETTAQSIPSGRLATSRWQGRPSISAYFGFTRCSSPAKPASIMFLRMMCPTDSGSALAPTTAIDFALKRAARLCVDMMDPVRPAREIRGVATKRGATDRPPAPVVSCRTQRDMRTGIVMLSRMPRVAPPSTTSRSREWL